MNTENQEMNSVEVVDTAPEMEVVEVTQEKPVAVKPKKDKQKRRNASWRI